MMVWMEKILYRNTIFLTVFFLGIVLPAAYAVRVFITYENPVDFRYFWAAGVIWADGGNPYSREFSQLAGDLYGIGDMHRWLYSPHVWSLTRLISEFDFDTSFLIWTVLNVVLIYIGTYLVCASVVDFSRRWHWVIALGLLFFSVTSGAASMSQTVGQFTSFSYVGIAAFVYAALRRREWFMVLALVVLTMKISLGLVFVVFCLAVPEWRRSVFVAGVISVVMALPAVLGSGLGAAVSGYLDGMAAYASYEPNAAVSMTGLRNLVFYLTGLDVSGAVLAISASLAGGFLALLGYRKHSLETVLALLGVTLFVVPLHNYELLLVSVLAIGMADRTFAAIYVVVFLCLYRVNRLSEVLGIEEATRSFGGSYLASLLLAVLMLAGLWIYVRSRRQPPLPA